MQVSYVITGVMKNIRKIVDIAPHNIPVFKIIHTIKKGYISCHTWMMPLIL
jgi:hypothetical protein